MNLSPLVDIVTHHRLVIDGLNRVQAAAFAPGGVPTLPPDLQALSPGDLIIRFERARDEAEGGAVVTLLGAVEALLRADLRVRGSKTRLDRRAQLLRRPGLSGDRVKLEHLIDAWRDVCGETGHGDGSRFKHALKLRHWFAHGRAWARPRALGRAVDLDDIWDVCEAFLNRVHSVDPTFPH